MPDSPDHGLVPIRAYVDMRADLLQLLVLTIDAKNMRYIDAVDQKNQKALEAALASEQLARNVALVELNRGLGVHNDIIRRNERESASTRGEMVTKLEFRPVADFVERARQSAITTKSFVGYMFTTAALAVAFGFGLASYLQSARNEAATRAATAATVPSESASSTPRVVIPLPPAQVDRSDPPRR